MPTLCQGIVDNNYFTFKSLVKKKIPTEEANVNAHTIDPAQEPID